MCSFCYGSQPAVSSRQHLLFILLYFLNGRGVKCLGISTYEAHRNGITIPVLRVIRGDAEYIVESTGKVYANPKGIAI